MDLMKTSLNVGMIGCGFMGRAHSNAYSQVAKFFPHTLLPVMRAVCARDARKLADFARTWGWQETETDWRTLVARPDIDIIDICEKPLAMNAEEGKRMLEAVRTAGLPNMVFYNYRRVPAVALARQILDEGRLGRIFHYRAKYLQDWTISPDLPMGGQTLWRLDAETAGSGVTGDLLAHAIDLALWLVGPIAGVSAMTETFIKERRRLRLSRPFRERGARHLRIDPLCPRKEKPEQLRNQRREWFTGFRPRRIPDPRILRQRRRLPLPGLLQDKRLGRGPPLHEKLVGARLRHRL
jgi:predicted dehydrogenase